MTSWSITYRDGSANAYRFAGTSAGATFDYEPVTPERSSTGHYSGGPPRSGTLDATTVDELWQLVRALERDRELHVADRMKGTGVLVITEVGETRSVIIARGPRLAELDAFAARLA